MVRKFACKSNERFAFMSALVAVPQVKHETWRGKARNVRKRLAAQMKYITVLSLCGVMTVGAVQAESDDAGDLAKASQNPIGSLVSLPFQNNTSFGIGPDDAVSNVLNIQPVYPVSLSPNWNLVNRGIVPVIYREEVFPGTGSASGSATSATPGSSRRPSPGS